MNGGKKRKKFRSRVISFVGILAGCLLVFAGYWVMQQMLNKRQSSLLSQSGTLSTASEEMTDPEQEEENRSKLTEEELSDILFRDHFTADTVPHEPYGRQMTMQEAIETGQNWVETFCSTYTFPAENNTIQFEEVSAQLCTGEMGDESFVYDTLEQEGEETFSVLYQMNRENRGNQLAESMYGYWNINFSGNGIVINLRINAVSGQVLSVMMETDFYETDEYISAMEELPARKILQNYMESFELEKDGQWQINENNYSINYGEDFRFYVETYPGLEELTDEDQAEYTEVYSYSFYLGVQTIFPGENLDSQEN